MTKNKILEEKIEKIIYETINTNKIPGLNVGIIQNGQKLYSNGFGYQNLEKTIAMTADSKLGIGSLSKSFTALAILQLVDANKIKLSDPVNKYIDYRLGTVEDPITIHHILSHSSGVPELDGTNYILDLIAQSTKKYLCMDTPKDFLHYINQAQGEIKYAPGEHYFYSNDHFTCAALIIEAISGEKYETYMHNHIFEPLGMDQTTFYFPNLKDDQRLSKFYLWNKQARKYKKVPFPNSHLLNPAGGILSTAKDMLKYLKFLMNHYRGETSKLLSAKTFKHLWEPAIELSHISSYKAYYCYGFLRLEDKETQEVCFGHGGNVIISSSDMLLDPASQTAVFVGANIGPANTPTLCMRLFNLVRGKDPNYNILFNSHYQQLQQLCGTYETYYGHNTLDISLKNGTLYAKLQNDTGLHEYPLINSNSNSDDLVFQIAYTYPINGLDFQFTIDEEEGIYVVHERYVFHKK